MAMTDFNPRPREEGDKAVIHRFAMAGISIHALVKRATKTVGTDTTVSHISIHALVKRATDRF